MHHHQQPSRLAYQVLYDENDPDYLIRIQQEEGVPSLSASQLLPYAAETLVALLHAAEAEGYDITDMLRRTVAYISEGTYDSEARGGQTSRF